MKTRSKILGRGKPAQAPAGGPRRRTPRYPFRILPLLRLVGLLCLVALAAGCTTQMNLPREKMTPGRTLGKTRVYIHDGSFYEFDRCSFLPDSLIGEYKLTVERTGPAEGSYYSEEVRSFRLPLDSVDSVRVVSRDLGKTLLYGAGGAAIVGLIVNMADRSSKTSSGPSDQTKPTPE